MSNFQRSAETWILGGEIDQQTVSDILRARYETDVTKPVLFLIDTPGGLAHATLGLLKELYPLQNLECRAIGHCASAGVHLMQAGTKRTCYPHTLFFLHALSTDEPVNGATIQAFADQFARDTDAWVDVLAKRTKKRRRDWWQKFLKTDQWVPAPEALKLGLVDEILSAQ
jgi:ATP-dependent protease ClpP protease subunit